MALLSIVPTRPYQHPLGKAVMEDVQFLISIFDDPVCS